MVLSDGNTIKNNTAVKNDNYGIILYYVDKNNVFSNNVTENKKGDCTEFANASAMLARYLGIPSRVVTGFVASKYLQLPKHKRALLLLQDRIEFLKQFDINDLYMVTTSHRHAWFQAYIPSFGWIDMEATQFAIPPQLGGNPNDWNLVIPLVKKENPKIIKEPFPWALIGIVSAAFLAGLVVLIYSYKFARELYLKVRSSSFSRAGIKALQRLLLAKLANRGFAHKPASGTIVEYAEKYLAVMGFAEIYTELSYRISIPDDEKTQKHRALRNEYGKILQETGRMGFWSRIKYVFWLAGIRY